MNLKIKPPEWRSVGCVADKNFPSPDGWIGIRKESYGYVITGIFNGRHADHSTHKTLEEAERVCIELYEEQVKRFLTPSTDLIYPQDLVPELKVALGSLAFDIVPIAYLMRQVGEPIPKGAEGENAYVLHWLIKMALEHGLDWGRVADERLAEMKKHAIILAGMAQPS